MRAPAIDGQAERRFRNEGIATARFERYARGVRLQLVVARRHPHFTAHFHAHLGRAQHVAGRMQRHTHAMVFDALAIGEALDGHGAQARAQHLLAGRGAQVIPVPDTRMVGMRMRDDGALDGTPRVDVELPRHTVQAFLAHHHHVCHALPPALKKRVGRADSSALAPNHCSAAHHASRVTTTSAMKYAWCFPERQWDLVARHGQHGAIW